MAGDLSVNDLGEVESVKDQLFGARATSKLGSASLD